MGRIARVILAGALLGALAATTPAIPADFADERSRMVKAIAEQTENVAPVTDVREIDTRILDAMQRVPRHRFVPAQLRRYAYLATPLPLGHGQNIASPYIVALMTHLADVQADTSVFETGTGAGYHAAVLAELGANVVSVEVVPDVANRARRNLVETDHAEVETHIGDGYYGWAEGGPYDAMLIKEALDHVPDVLLDQLKPGGKLVLPLGPLDGRQHLTVVTKTAEGETDRRRVLPVRFSPLQGGQRT